MCMITLAFILMYILCERFYLYSTDQTDPRSVDKQWWRRASAQVILIMEIGVSQVSSLREMAYREAPTEKLVLGSSSLWYGFSVNMQVSIGHSSQLWIWEKAQLSCGNLEYWRR